MFDQLEASSIQDRISDGLYKWRGIGHWPEAEAKVFARIWTPDDENPGYGNLQVRFSYVANSQIYSKKFGKLTVEKDRSYLVGDTFT
jgi:hypothetical protein